MLLLIQSALAYAQLPTTASFGEGLDISLQEAIYGDGIITTEKGGIIRGKEFTLQARYLQYIRTTDTHKISAKDQLLLEYKGKFYRGDKAEMDLTTGKVTIWNGCTQEGISFFGGSRIEVFPDGHALITDAYITTSENERNDWTARATEATVTKGSHIDAKNVTFYFIRMPFFWVPSFSSDLLKGEGGPFRYRIRWGGSEGLRLGISYLFRTGALRHRAIVDYSFKLGFGGGLRSQYRSETGRTKFDALNYVAQPKEGGYEGVRYRMQGLLTDYFEGPGLHFRAMYDKLSDRQMKNDFSEHAVSDARAGLTQATLWRGEPDWKASLNGRVQINAFQTVKQELPLLTWTYRPQPIGKTPFLLDTQASTGYLNYVYGRQTPHVHNFDSTRTDINQKVYTTFHANPFAITPHAGYRLIHYSDSPQHRGRLQAIGDVGIGVLTRFSQSSKNFQQIVEPYAQETSLTRPAVVADRTYIFDIQDGWAQLNECRYGVRHQLWYTGAADFQPRIRSDLFARSFFASHHIHASPYKIWFNSVLDATSKSSYKLDSAWDPHHNRMDHVNVAMRRTITQKLAFIMEWRQRSPYAWRKLDLDNFIVDAVRSDHQLRHSQMSDARKTLLGTLAWRPSPIVDVDLSAWYGWRKVSPRHYLNYEVTITTLVRGALRVSLTYQWRQGGPTNGVYLSVHLGPKHESSDTKFEKIGQGNYDLW